mmetsp:Transcript_82400/g.229312  ORF Transcript_82400/g.229312 Transcript_82400/m.229312 type:complete len:216 (-) Transcript_82400:144-791(-)
MALISATRRACEASYSAFFFSLPRMAYASLMRVNRASSISVWFASGWCTLASARYTSLISSVDADRGSPSTLYQFSSSSSRVRDVPPAFPVAKARRPAGMALPQAASPSHPDARPAPPTAPVAVWVRPNGDDARTAAVARPRACVCAPACASSARQTGAAPRIDAAPRVAQRTAPPTAIEAAMLTTRRRKEVVIYFCPLPVRLPGKVPVASLVWL